MRIIFTLLVLFSALARADEFTRQSAPQKWIDALLPEDLPALDHPTWANDLDKAKLEAFRGRYKKSLLTLQKVPDSDPVQVALIKSTALAETGRRDKAIEALSKSIVTNNPKVQV